MAFEVEDGSGVEGANAYISTDFGGEYHGDRGNTQWEDYNIIEKAHAIVRASDYIDKRFGRRFRGERKIKNQGLEWPRLDAFDDDGFLLSDIDSVPRQIQKACAEYALRALIYNVLAPDAPRNTPDQSWVSGEEERGEETNAGNVSRKREVVGPIEDETWYQSFGVIDSQNLGAAARGVQSSVNSDYYIPEYPEADMWIEELVKPSMQMRTLRGD